MCLEPRVYTGEEAFPELICLLKFESLRLPHPMHTRRGALKPGREEELRDSRMRLGVVGQPAAL